ncbi:Aep3p KNAG_0D02620 [Huiozyma naganishii CBS 8797]|uniref:ATPase expression protein 3 n=1 Tax=Huiozyma naganishii (strain ATCC MYA-139 / BCRC 22969 / CBS 8797 / KCTC 17520 / NBRC 10181 / NCYC 3082 / Yp74L-3) TaxID=1071383 RepID=J7S6Z6_HUIN7|nr:hypothetical protein KNAG_0D02620 [Kazachstania naganishii CBS 8797]CCK70011.1 hypothetical protein KNAG_0D02620 [Kazachstania naganishii CBS 8797]
MNVSQKFGELIRKGSKSFNVNVQRITMLAHASNQSHTGAAVKVRRSRGKVDVHRLVTENLALVGRGSQFEKKAVQQFLSPLQEEGTFQRQNVSATFDTERAVKLHRLNKELRGDPKLAPIIDTNFLDQVLRLLEQLTPRTDLETGNVVSLRSTAPEHRPPLTSQLEVPHVPDFTLPENNNSEAFARYIGLLTHGKFIKDSQLPLLIRALLHPFNETTAPLFTVRNFNDAMFYFRNKWDIASMRETFSLIRLCRLHRDTMSYNLMLGGVLRNARIRKVGNTTREFVYYLEQMLRDGVSADAHSWGVVYDHLLSDEARSRLLARLWVISPQLGRSSVLMMRVMQNCEDPEKVVKFMREHHVALTSGILRLLLRKYLAQDRIGEAWQVLQRAPTRLWDVGMLNGFLICLANRGRVDMCLMVIGNFQSARVPLDGDVFRWLYKALVRNGYTRKFAVVYQEITRWHRRVCPVRNTYWKVKCDTIVKFNCKGSDPTREQEQKLQLLLSGVTCKGSLTWDVWNVYPDLRPLLRFLGVVKGKGSRSGTAPSHSISDEGTKEKKRRYRERIRHISVGNAMAQRIPYARDTYGALARDFFWR